MNNPKQLTPLEQIRLEKRQFKKRYQEEGERLVHNWDYLSNNVSSILFNSVVNSAKDIIGLGNKTKTSIPTPFGQSSTLGSIFSGLTASFPIIWEFVQPMIIRFVVKKITNLFSSKNEKEDN